MVSITMFAASHATKGMARQVPGPASSFRLPAFPGGGGGGGGPGPQTSTGSFNAYASRMVPRVPAAGVGQQAVGEAVLALVGLGIGLGGAAQQAQAHDVVRGCRARTCSR